MTDEIKTPAGRTLLRRSDTPKGERVYSDAWGEMRVTIGMNDFVALYGAVCMNHYASLGAALDWLDARADETVAALLPPGAIVVTEERVRELASILVKRIAGDHVSGLARVGAVDALVRDLRAGAKS